MELDRNHADGSAVIPSRDLAKAILMGLRESGGGETYRSFVTLVLDLGLSLDLLIQTTHVNYEEAFPSRRFDIFMLCEKILSRYAMATG